MAKVYRLHEGQDGTGWFLSNPISKNQLITIKTEGKGIATSIPSPFARIDLVKSAFRWVTDNGIDGETAQHKLVSDTLDVAQLFFLYKKHKEKLKIISWNPYDRFTELSKSPNYKHATFSETLKVFWELDGSVYNFKKINRLYFILNNSNQVIGGTSPATLFFPAPDVRNATEGLNITFGKDVLFDNNFSSLADRDDKLFIEYFFILSKQAHFADLFPEVYSYLTEVFNTLDEELRTRIAGLSANDLNMFDPCPVLDNEMDSCEILGIPLRMKLTDPHTIEAESDFVIIPELSIEGLKPLVLPHERFNHRWVYSTKNVLWNPQNVIPSKNDQSLSMSRLPVQGDHYPWLTVDNFFEDKIVQLPYSIDNRKFKKCGSTKFLLPLTPVFFQYFKAKNVSNYLELTQLAGGGVDVKLKIPVRGGTIILRKSYHKEDMIFLELHLAIMPFLQMVNFDLDYILGLQDKRYNKDSVIQIECFLDGRKLAINEPIIRKQGEGAAIRSAYYRTKSFDAVRIGTNGNNGFIVPAMPVSQASQQISFAIDFGTTNTHIEYKYESQTEKPFEVMPDLPIWQSLIDRLKDEPRIGDDNNYEGELFPYQIDPATNFKFPFRTALTYNQNINFNEQVNVFTHTNNYFLFEKIHYSRYFNVRNKLKWSNYSKPEDKILVESYIKGLMYMVLYKTLLLHGDPKRTIITWFYPVSMESFERGIFFDVWQNAYKKIFRSPETDNIHVIPESTAPYLFYRTEYPGLSLSIDIGGGSSDIALFKNATNSPEFISSFKFAGNAIFGDGFPHGAFSNSTDNNGFVKAYRKAIEDAIKGVTRKEEILHDILTTRKDSSDFSSFLFSFENEADFTFNYTERLKQDKKLKLPILVFYSAIIYYSAHLLAKQRVMEIPSNILFSGTASKTIRIIDTLPGFPNITELFTFFFKKIMGVDASKITVVLADNPKEITCKGALKAAIDKDLLKCPSVFWIGGKGNSIWNQVLDKNKDVPITPLYKNVNDKDTKKYFKESISDYFSLMDEYFLSKNLEASFGINKSAYIKFKEIRSQNITNYLEQGLKAFYKSPEGHIEETLFFYPLIGILHKLALELANIKDK